jgi:hypothetical protein
VEETRVSGLAVSLATYLCALNSARAFAVEDVSLEAGGPGIPATQGGHNGSDLTAGPSTRSRAKRRKEDK